MEKVFRGIAYVIATCLLFGTCGCESVRDWMSGARHQANEPNMTATWWDGPRVRPGIALVVQVGPVGSPPTVMNVQVDQNGEILLPLLLQEPVACDGLSLEALKAKLMKAYAKYYRQPMITVTFAPYSGNGVSPWGTVKVLGQVGRPGPVNMPSTMDLTVTKVLMEAGGCKPFADQTSIVVTRCDKDGNQIRTRVNIEEIGKKGRGDLDMQLRAGDVVYVPETWY